MKEFINSEEVKMPLSDYIQSLTTYVSCIKINNVPILPPLITQNKRKEIISYRKQAIKVESRIKKERELKAMIHHYSDLLDKQQSSTNLHELDDEVIESRQPKLTCNIQSSEFVNDKFVALQTDEELPPTPKLIRSNSYILETPSPALIEHLKQNEDRQRAASSELKDDLEMNVSKDYDLDTSCTETELKNLSDQESQFNVTENNLKQFIDNNVPIEELNVSNVTYISEPVPKPAYDSKLENILKSIPQEYSKKIYEILEKQSNRSRTNSVNSADFNELQENAEKFSTPISGSDEHSTFFYSAFEKGDTEIYELTEEKKMEKAAYIITAAAKGFLVRRLFRTERVQDLINTIQDALVCAVQLHSENVDDINESDVELHRRLIQQVSAGCYAFHDMFFNTSIREKMYCIASDREKKREKASRPVSAAKSTPRSASSRKSK